MVAFDAGFIIDALASQPEAKERLDHLVASGEPLAVTPVSAAEVLRGAHRRGGRYLDAAVAMFQGFVVLEFDLAAAMAAGRIDAEMAASGRPLGQGDTLTAGIVVRHGERLLTRDAAFSHVRGLRVERY